MRKEIHAAHQLFLHKNMAKSALQDLRSFFGKRFCVHSFVDPDITETFLSQQIDRFTILAMTPRSGSTLLSFTLNQIEGVKGKGEWLRWKNQALRRRANVLRAHNPLDMIVDKWQQLEVGHTEMLALKCSFGQFAPLLFIPALREKLNSAKWIYLTRQDILGQAISKYRADLTGYHHSDRPPDGTSNSQIQAPPVTFDREMIDSALRAICQQMMSWEYLFACLNIKPLRLTYEDLTAEFGLSIERTANHIGSTLTATPDINSTGLRKVGDDLNTSLAAKFQVEAMGIPSA